MANFFRRVAGAIWLAGVVLSGCSPPAPDVRFLASDAYFVVAGQRIVIPFVAMRQPDRVFSLSGERAGTTKAKLQAEAGDPASPMKIEKLDLLIREYRYTGEHIASVGICPLLKRRWSEALCLGQRRGVIGRLPEKFDLVDLNSPDALKSAVTVDREQAYDQFKSMTLRSGVTEVSCDEQSRFCAAAVEVLPGLLAVWTVWSDEKTGGTATRMAETQGTAIVQFVRRAIGSDEDPSLLNAE